MVTLSIEPTSPTYDTATVDAAEFLSSYRDNVDVHYTTDGDVHVTVTDRLPARTYRNVAKAFGVTVTVSPVR